MKFIFNLLYTFLCLVSISNFIFVDVAAKSANKSSLYYSLANGKEFLYRDQNFRKICSRTHQKISLLWMTRLFELPPPSLYGIDDSLEQFSYQVRVLLEEVSDQNARTISSEKGIVVSPSNNLKKRALFPMAELQLVFKAGFWYLNNKKSLVKQLIICPVDGYLVCNDKQYAGSMLLVADNDKGYVISQLDIEAYIYSVLRSESWPGWPIEVNKAFAIASRSYVVSKILEAEKKKQLFHIKNTNVHQTYNGMHAFTNLQTAVEETKGVILAYEQRPIIAMFDSCCGGVIPGHIEDAIDFTKAPYLAREYACTFCKEFRIFSWKAEYALHEVRDLLRDSGVPIAKLYDIQVTKRDKAGVVQEVAIYDGKTKYTLNGRQCYSLFAHVKSFCFSIAKKKGKIVVDGRGYGHHLGICQWGARAMIDHGWDFKRILEFYYPGTYFVRLKTT